MTQLSDRKKVAWVKDVFCPMSETFIYEPLPYFKRWLPIILAQKVENLEYFPYEYVIPFAPERYNTFFYRTTNNLFYKNEPFENFVREHCRRHKARLVHAHFAPSAVASMNVVKKLRLPLITTFYGYDVSELPKRDEFWRDAFQHLFAIGDLFIVEGPFMKQQLVRLGCPQDKIRIVHIGVDVEKYPFKPRNIQNNEKIKILMAGRFVEKKGFEYGIRAFAEVVKEFKNVQLRIVGDGPLKGALENLVSELGIAESVLFIGFVTHEEFRQEIFGAHIGLVPSATASNGDNEGGAPKILLEMQASGLPVVASRHADIPNVVLDGKSAKLVDERDISGLAQALKELLEAPQLWLNMGKQGSEYMMREFSLHQTVTELEKIYDSVSYN